MGDRAALEALRDLPGSAGSSGSSSRASSEAAVLTREGVRQKSMVEARLGLSRKGPRRGAFAEEEVEVKDEDRRRAFAEEELAGLRRGALQDDKNRALPNTRRRAVAEEVEDAPLGGRAADPDLTFKEVRMHGISMFVLHCRARFTHGCTYQYPQSQKWEKWGEWEKWARRRPPKHTCSTAPGNGHSTS